MRKRVWLGRSMRKPPPLAKIKVERPPQDALRCGLSGVTSFVRSDVAKVVNANCPRRHLQVAAGTFSYPGVLLKIAFNMTRLSIPVLDI